MAEPLPLCHLNGIVMPLGEARISPLDRGFLYGDGVYEVTPVYGGRPFRHREHMARLARSLAAIRLRNPHDSARWDALFAELIGRNGGGDQYLYLQVSRGAEYGRNHAPLPDIEPTVFAFCAPLPTPDPAVFERGIRCITTTDTRWLRCDVKSVSLLANVLLRQLAIDAGAAETILFRDGLLTEASSSAVHVVIDGVLIAPPNSPRILPGTTRAMVEELAAATGVPMQTREITERELRGADEIWLTAAIRGLAPVTRLDERPVGAGAPGPVWRRMQDEFKALLGRLAGTPW
jgi:D-alanine transaminase